MRKLLFCILFLSVLQIQAQTTLHFKNGQFKIIQFTDLHWSEGDKYKSINDSTASLMKNLIKEEQPNLVVLTGDIAVSNEADRSWKDIIAIMKEADVPFIVNFGNHDTETAFTKQEQLNILMKEPLSLTFNASEFIDGVGNCHIPIRAEKSDSTKWVLYFFDSHSYTNNHKELGYYDWIKGNQIEWYRSVSNKYKLQRNTTLPALAFFHIPLPEYKTVKEMPETLGNKLEEVCSPKVNSGLFSAFIEQKDVLGVFTGHDHNNDYIGVLSKIALAYGRKTGYASAYKELLDRGARVIIISENDAIMKTYIRTLSATEYEFEYAR